MIQTIQYEKNFLYLDEDGIYQESFDAKIVKKYLGEKTETFVKVPIEGDRYMLTEHASRLPFDLSQKYDPIGVPLVNERFFYINFFGEPFSFQHVSFVDIYTNNFDPSLVENKIVLIGEMGATGLHDVEYTPVSKGIEMPGSRSMPIPFRHFSQDSFSKKWDKPRR